MPRQVQCVFLIIMRARVHPRAENQMVSEKCIALDANPMERGMNGVIERVMGCQMRSTRSNLIVFTKYAYYSLY